MAITTRYFSTAGAGAADGTSWANRAQLVSGATWSTVITGFNFAGSDSLLCLIGPGTHTTTAALASGLFANAPSAVNPLFFQGCDASGVQLEPPDPDWTSDMPAWSTTGVAVIATTTNISTINLAHCFLRLLVFTASGATTNAPLNSAAAADWVQATNSGSNTAAQIFSANLLKMTNCYYNMTGASYAACGAWTTNDIRNCRFSGIGGGGTSGNRNGVVFSGSATPGAFERNTVFGFAGDGIGSASATASHFMNIARCVFANNTGDGINANATASQTGHHRVERCCITGNGGYGVEAASAANVFATNCRLRDNTVSNLGNFLNYPTGFSNYTTDSDDATEYVDASSTYDFRIKNTAAIWGKGYGVSDEPTTAGAAGILRHPGMNGGLNG